MTVYNCQFFSLELRVVHLYERKKGMDLEQHKCTVMTRNVFFHKYNPSLLYIYLFLKWIHGRMIHLVCVFELIVLQKCMSKQLFYTYASLTCIFVCFELSTALQNWKVWNLKDKVMNCTLAWKIWIRSVNQITEIEFIKHLQIATPSNGCNLDRGGKRDRFILFFSWNQINR